MPKIFGILFEKRVISQVNKIIINPFCRKFHLGRDCFKGDSQSLACRAEKTLALCNSLDGAKNQYDYVL